KLLEGNFKDGVLNGKVETWYDNGTIKQVLNYEMGQKVGKNLTYHPNGNLSEKASYKKTETGWEIEAEVYFEDGKLFQKQMYLMPLSQQKANLSPEQRKMQLETTSKPGQKDYDKSLIKTEKTVRTGTWTTYHTNKKVAVKETFINDK